MVDDLNTGKPSFAWLPVGALRPWDKNPRRNTSAVEPVARSLERFGFVSPVVIWASGGRMVAGHTRLKAMQAILGRDPSFIPRGAPGPGLVPVRFQEFASEAEADAYALADNRLAEIAKWDEELLPGVLRQIQQEDAELLKLAGWTDGDLRRYLPDEDKAGEDAPEPTAELRKKWQTELGQLWAIPSRSTPGREHRVICGDSMDAAVAEKLRGGARWALMVTDPPYGVEYDPSWRDDIGGQLKPGKVTQRGLVSNDDKADWAGVWALWQADVAYVWHASMFVADVARGIDEAGYQRRAYIIWRKPHFLLSRGDYHWQHEPCWYAVRKGSRSGWCGDRTQTTMWDIKGLNPLGKSTDPDDAKVGHGTQKPVECMARPMRNHFEPGVVVCDPFLGSGTSLVAAEREKRICHGAELSPEYLAVILERATKLGLEPRLT